MFHPRSFSVPGKHHASVMPNPNHFLLRQPSGLRATTRDRSSLLFSTFLSIIFAYLVRIPFFFLHAVSCCLPAVLYLPFKRVIQVTVVRLVLALFIVINYSLSRGKLMSLEGRLQLLEGLSSSSSSSSSSSASSASTMMIMSLVDHLGELDKMVDIVSGTVTSPAASIKRSDRLKSMDLAYIKRKVLALEKHAQRGIAHLEAIQRNMTTSETTTLDTLCGTLTSVSPCPFEKPEHIVDQLNGLLLALGNMEDWMGRIQREQADAFDIAQYDMMVQILTETTRLFGQGNPDLVALVNQELLDKPFVKSSLERAIGGVYGDEEAKLRHKRAQKQLESSRQKTREAFEQHFARLGTADLDTPPPPPPPPPLPASSFGLNNSKTTEFIIKMMVFLVYTVDFMRLLAALIREMKKD